MDIAKAKAQHAKWKMLFRTAIETGGAMDVETIADDHCCELGRWLHGEAKINYGEQPAYLWCVEAHAEFHQQAGQVAQTINAQCLNDASDMLRDGSAFARASARVDLTLEAFGRLIQELARRPGQARC